MKIDGEKISSEIINQLEKKLAVLGIKPTLKIILVGSDSASRLFVGKKRDLAKKLGVSFELKVYKSSVKGQLIIDQIDKWQSENQKLGIVVQLPLPAEIDRIKIIDQIKPEADVDGLRICAGLRSNFTPPVVLAIERSLVEAKINLENRKIAIVGSGFLVGQPTYRYLTSKYPQAEIKVFSRDEFKNYHELEKYDVVIGAANESGIISAEMIKEGTVIIDAGSIKQGRKILGNFQTDCYPKSAVFTPVPGGIGPLTVAYLYDNLVTIMSS